MQIKFSVVIVTYNRKKLLEECLNQVFSQSIAFHEVIVVDNYSIDGTYDYLEEQLKEHNNLKVYHMDSNLGGAGGFTTAISKVSEESEYTLIIDDDAMIDVDFVKNIQSEIQPEILAYSGTVKTDSMIDTSHRRRITNKIFMTKIDVDKREYENRYFDYDLSTFCGLMINSKLISKIGLPNAEYFIWYDDTEYSLRIRQNTIIRNINSAIINHKTKIDVGSGKLGWKSYYGYRNQWDMGKRYSSVSSLYCIYRKLFHIYRIFQCVIFMKTIKSDSNYYEKLKHMHKDVMMDNRKNKLGKNIKYLPGTF